MDFKLLLFAQILMLLLVAGLLGAVHYALSHALHRMKMDDEQNRMMLRLVMTAILLWLLILSLMAYLGYLDQGVHSYLVLIVVFLASLLGILLLLRVPFIRIGLAFLPPQWLYRIHAYRIIHDFLLWVGFAGGFIPAQLTFEWLNFDLFVGFSALLAAQAFFRRRPYRKVELALWNTFGLVSILNLFLIALISTPGQWQLFKTTPDNSFMLQSPFIWIPGFTIPFAIAMHLLAFRQMRSFNEK
ncbi:MAG TPA: hypothetical protein PKA00_09140 [Saprospiraceae bacterium]|nr:hypothetical protein [Saprospiraceae bacterium]HMQ83061.1 hypothetical protein [Saprospiraceae bacterium]